jgi:hypothetical protein
VGKACHRQKESRIQLNIWMSCKVMVKYSIVLKFASHYPDVVFGAITIPLYEVLNIPMTIILVINDPVYTILGTTIWLYIDRAGMFQCS